MLVQVLYREGDLLPLSEIRDMESVIDSVQSEVDSEVEEGIAKLVASC